MIRLFAVLCCSVLPRLMPSSGMTDHLWVASMAFEASGGDEVFGRQPELAQLGTEVTLIALGYLPDLRTLPSGQCHREFTNMSQFLVIHDSIKGVESAWINLLLGHFLKGTGSENIVFPVNHAVSNFMKPSFIVNSAINAYLDYLSAGGKGEFHIKPSFSTCFFAETSNRLTPLTMPQFVGSADIYISQTGTDNFLFRIFNVSSITSGSLGKEIFPDQYWPVSVVRDESEPIQRPCSNVMQLFQFTMTRLELLNVAGLKINIIK